MPSMLSARLALPLIALAALPLTALPLTARANVPGATRPARLPTDTTSAPALRHLSQVEVDSAEYDADAAHRRQLLERALEHARRALVLDSTAAEGHFAVARAAGRLALALDLVQRPAYAREVHAQATACLAIQPDDPGCLHVLGVWNAEVMRLGDFERSMANSLSGTTLFTNASWGEAERLLKAAVARERNRALHHLDLGRVYADEKKTAAARAEFKAAIAAPARDPNDSHYHDEARQALSSLP